MEYASWNLILIKKDQFNRKNNIDVQGKTSDIDDDSVENKVTEMLAGVCIVATKLDIGNCHKLGNSNTIVRFANRKFCNDILEKKFDLHRKIGRSKLGFDDTNTYASENLTPYNQRLI